MTTQENKLRELFDKHAYIAGRKTSMDLENFLTIIPQIAEIMKGECEWKFDLIGEYYDTACGQSHTFIDGDLKDNFTKFCPYCGGKIKEVQPLPQSPKD